MSKMMLCFLSLCFVNLLLKVYFLLQVTTLCCVILILHSIEATWYPYFIHVHMFTMSL